MHLNTQNKSPFVSYFELIANDNCINDIYITQNIINMFNIFLASFELKFTGYINNEQ